MEADLPTAP